MDFDLVAAVLKRLKAAENADERLEEAVDVLARELGVEPIHAAEACEFIETKGLGSLGDETFPAEVRRAGEQYLALKGEVDRSILAFLPDYVDDLNARRALISAGTVLVDEFQDALLKGRGVGFAQDLIPEAFKTAVTERLALDLYSAAVALMVRLSDGEPAGCVGEEIVAVELMGRAESWLEMEVGSGVTTAEEAEEAAPELRSLFDLFQDDDVLDLFEMEEPADAAVAGHSWTNQQMGAADQRIEAWFRPFSWTIGTGYLHDGSDS